MMAALYERRDVLHRNRGIVEKFLRGVNRKDIAEQEGVTYWVVCDAIKKSRRAQQHMKYHARCSCGGRRR